MAQGLDRAKYFSIASLVAANVIPLAGLAFWQWSFFNLIFLYWLESVVIGFYNVFKMFVVDQTPTKAGILFFAVHYGGFMTGYLITLASLFGAPITDTHHLTPSKIHLAWDTFAVFRWHIVFAAASLILSHGISFFVNFIGKEECFEKSPMDLMFEPYIRMLPMEAMIIACGLFYHAGKATTVGLVLMVILKTAADVWSHAFERRRARKVS